jgi:inosine-uridine nucleoside N-ribohydrolase
MRGRVSRLANAKVAAQTRSMTCVLIDCDPGLDDAVALLAAFGTADLDVRAITTVAGNVKGPQTAMNARIIREVAGLDTAIPVCAGAPRPMLRDPVTAEDFHGSTGLGDIPFPDPKQPLSELHSVNMIIEACRGSKDDPLTLIVTGPMTNVALALTMAPDIADGIAEIVLMGGADTEGGNITPFSEFNVFADPHAAASVFGSGLPVRCLSLDVTHTVRATQARLSHLQTVRTKQAEVAVQLLDASCKLEFSANGARDAPLHDPSTVIAVTRPDLFQGRRAHVEVITERGEQFGRTIPHFDDDGPVMWYTQADDDGVFEELARLLGGFE